MTETTTRPRTDIHRPSAIRPEEYRFVAFGYMKVEDLGSAMALQHQRQLLQDDMARTGGAYARHHHGGTCHVCGVACIYTAVFHHEGTNVYIKTGLDCAEKMEMAFDSGAADMFRASLRDALANQAGKRKAKAILEGAELAGAWTVYTATPAHTDRREEETVRDIVGKLVQYGSLSDKQLAFLGKLLDAIANRSKLDAQREAERLAASPVPVGDQRIAVRGTVVAVKRPDDRNMYNGPKLLLQAEAGWKLWGNLPLALDGVRPGDVVSFMAKVTPSDRDDRFGFYLRPTKVAVVSRVEG